jgi:hypothetical protein
MLARCLENVVMWLLSRVILLIGWIVVAMLRREVLIAAAVW